MRYLYELILQEGKGIPVEELIGRRHGIAPANLRGSKGPKIDPVEQRDLHAEFKRLQEEMNHALAAQDMDRFDDLQRQQEAVQAELNAGESLGGKPVLVSDLDRHRVAVKQAIDRAIVQIGQLLPDMAEHFRLYVETGLKPCYRPTEAERRAWET
jgi:hypothetical protein